MEHGEFCMRGSLLDLYPMGSTQPYRVDFFDDEIDSIRLFDADTQLSTGTVDAIDLLPAHDFPTDPTAIERFRVNYRKLFDASNDRESVYMQVSNRQFPGGIEYYLPLFFESTASLFDYLPANTLLITLGDLQAHLDQLWRDIQQRYEQRRYDIQRPILAPQQLYLSVDSIHGNFKALPRIRAMVRSEEHTSELQSRPHLVCRLLLEKKKKKKQHKYTH